MVISLHGLIGLHVYSYFSYIIGPLKRRLGTAASLGWLAIGLTLLFNIIFNHTMAMVVKPGSPKDLRRVENLRDQLKRRTNRKSDKDALENDRFEGISSDVKQLLKFRHKTTDDT